MTKIEEIQKEIEYKKIAIKELEKLKKLEIRHLAVKDLSEFTMQEKCEKFDKLYNLALSVLTEAETNKYFDENESHFDENDFFEIIARDETTFWEYCNSLEDDEDDDEDD